MIMGEFFSLLFLARCDTEKHQHQIGSLIPNCYLSLVHFRRYIMQSPLHASGAVLRQGEAPDAILSGR